MKKELYNYRIDDIEKNLRIANLRPLDIMVTGNTGAGKSTTLNALFTKEVAKVGTGVSPETMELKAYSLNDTMRFWDTPGLGDGVEMDKIHSQKLIKLLYDTYTLGNQDYGFIDLVIVIVEGINRDMGTTYKLLNEIIVPNFQKDRILIAINQADVAMKGRGWNYNTNTPDEKLFYFLESQALSIQRRIKEATGVVVKRPIYYSAEYGYNITKFYDFIIDNMPRERREIFFELYVPEK